MAYKRILYEKVDPRIVKITMNRPEKRNALDFLMLAEIQDAFVEADLDDDVRVIIWAGKGPDFSAGHDMSGTGENPDPNSILGRWMRRSQKYSDMLSPEAGLLREDHIYYDQAMVMRNVSKPTIAMVQGHCYAAAFMNACMCDLIVASDDASFANPVIGRLTASAVEIFVEPWEFGPRRAKEMLWTGEPVTVQEAKHYGVVSRVVPRDKLEEATMELARKIAAAPPLAVSLVKKSVNHTLDAMGQQESWSYHYMTHLLSHASQESAEARKAFGHLRGTDMKAFLAARDAATSPQSK